MNKVVLMLIVSFFLITLYGGVEPTLPIKERIGIMSAMDEESASILPLIKNQKSEIIAGRKFYSGMINETPVVLVSSRYGKVAAACTAAILINEFKISRIIFIGVAGAVSNKLNIGDIVISDKLYQHDMDGTPLFKKYEIPLNGKIFIEADKALVNKSKSACELFFEKQYKDIDKDSLQKLHIAKPVVYVGIIATGDQFIYKKEQSEPFMKDIPDTMAVEMEGAAVAQVCDSFRIPFVVMRIISDKANHDSPIDFGLFITTVTNSYSKGIIENFFSNAK